MNGSSLAVQSSFAELARRCVEEDLGEAGDPTGRSVGSAIASARVIARQGGVVAGMAGLNVILEEFSLHFGGDALRAQIVVEDGWQVKSGAILVDLHGPASALLAAERSVLNVLGRLCGIATLTSQFVSAVQGTNAVVRDTRKTTPGLRILEKYAVRCGGGQNHRMGLYDALLVKDNHIAAWGSVKAAVTAARKIAPGLPLEVEVDTLAQLRDALDCQCSLILLDNMALDEMAEAVEMVAGLAKTEASGGITLANARMVADTGVDYLAVGALTHSAPALDIGLDWDPWSAA